jgi:cytochrome c-type biogenesis protein CcmE
VSRLDEELEKSIRESEEAAGAEPVVVSTPETPPAKRNIGLLAGLIVMGGGILGLLLTSFDHASIYNKTVSQALDERESLVGRNVRIQGELKRCTLVKRDQPCEYRFTVFEGTKELQIRYPQCVLPDTIRDVPGVQVTAEGALDPDGHFQATNVFGKCASKYKEARAQGVEMAKLAPCPVPVTME